MTSIKMNNLGNYKMIKNDKKRFYIEEQLSEHLGETPEGFLIAEGVPVARTGTQTYKADEVPITPRDDGLIEIRREETEVFDPDTIKSFEGKPFCIDHPDEMVTPENWKELAHGFITNVRRGIGEQIDLLIGDIVITTNKAIELVKAGMRELSCGYDANYEQLEKGVGIQKSIRGNHIALVMRGRAGHRCAIGDKECNHCEQCKNKNMEDIEDMELKKFKAAFMKALDSIKDEEELIEEKKKAEDKKIKDEETAKIEELKAIKDKLAKDEDLSEEEMEKLEKEADTTEEEKEKIKDKRMAKDKKVKDDEGEIDLTKQVEKLTDIVEALVTSTGEAQSNFDKKFKDVEAKVEELKALDKKAKDADEEDDDEEKEKIEAKDCDLIWPDIAARADVLSPGIKLVKPTKDHSKSLEAIKKEAIKAAYATDKDTIAPIVKIKSLDKLTGDSLDSIFVAASELIQNRNNIKTKDSVVFKSKEAQSEIQKINARNKEFYNKK